MGKRYSTMLSIAGSDPSGGAGIQADIKTATVTGSYAMAVITAVTAQNSLGVAGVEAVTPAMLRLQLDTLLSDIEPAVVKIGMIPDEASAGIIADAIERYNLKTIVLDPVLVSTSGHSLAGKNVIRVLRERIIPESTLITPNMAEAEAFLGTLTVPANDVNRLADMFTGTAVLLKGGHCPEADYTTDYLRAGGDTVTFRHRFYPSVNTHGTGCTLSSAIASYLAQGYGLTESVSLAVDWLSGAIREGMDYTFGSPDGHGPVNHLYKL